MSQVIHGKVHGTTIELYQPLGIPDGQEVELTLQTVPPVVESRQWGDGLRRCAGALADIPGLDQDMEQSEFAQVCQQVKHWPSELRQNLAEEITKSLAAELPASNGEWNDAKNERRCELIDKDIQGSLSAAEGRELESLTQQMRAYRRAVARIPIAGATRLHQQLLEKKRQQQETGGETP